MNARQPHAVDTDRELPMGRLTNFEDDDPADIATLLPRRTPTRPTHTPPVPPTIAPDVAPTAPELVPDTATPPAPDTEPTPAQPTPPAGRQNRIRSSSMHIRSTLVERIIRERENTGRSNGNIIIAALEAVHEHLPELLPNTAAPTGGSLFAARTTRTPRTETGPYSPLNVRLYEADFAILDDLVHTSGARSRSHLVDIALAHYFDTDHS